MTLTGTACIDQELVKAPIWRPAAILKHFAQKNTLTRHVGHCFQGEDGGVATLTRATEDAVGISGFYWLVAIAAFRNCASDSHV